MKIDDKDMLKEKQAGKIMNVSDSTMQKHRHQGRGCPYYKIGRAVRYKMEDIQAYLEKHRITPNNF